MNDIPVSGVSPNGSPRQVRYSRPLTDAEKDILRVAAELTRSSWDGVSLEVHDQMQAWSRRLKIAHDALLAEILVSS